ncbi:MAG: hypothetical protein HYU57_08505 [Micavibrio aeruginosavorus]|nr:hypothetical protein [Micavibrio aeruginosavorus]
MPTSDQSSKEILFLIAVGRFTINWASLEAVLDTLSTIAHVGFGGDKIEAEMPQALDRKLRFLKKFANGLPNTASVKPKILELVENVKQLSEVRHDLIHGVVVSRQSEDQDYVKMVRILKKSENYRHKNFTFTAEEIFNHAKAVSDLTNQSLLWVMPVSENKLSDQ